MLHKALHAFHGKSERNCFVDSPEKWLYDCNISQDSFKVKVSKLCSGQKRLFVRLKYVNDTLVCVAHNNDNYYTINPTQCDYLGQMD